MLPPDIWRSIIPFLDPTDSLVNLAKTCKTLNRLCQVDGRLRRYYWGYLQKDIIDDPWIISKPGIYRIRENLTVHTKHHYGVIVRGDDIHIDGMDHSITVLHDNDMLVAGTLLDKGGKLYVKDIQFVTSAPVSSLRFNSSHWKELTLMNTAYICHLIA